MNKMLSSRDSEPKHLTIDLRPATGKSNSHSPLAACNILDHGFVPMFCRNETHFANKLFHPWSDLQHDKIDSAAWENIDRAIGSDQLASMVADANMFGEHAILRQVKKPV